MDGPLPSRTHLRASDSWRSARDRDRIIFVVWKVDAIGFKIGVIGFSWLKDDSDCLEDPAVVRKMFSARPNLLCGLIRHNPYERERFATVVREGARRLRSVGSGDSP